MAADVLPLSSGDDEALRAIRVAAEYLANLPEIERGYYLPRRAEEIGVSERVLKSAVTAVQRERAMKAEEQKRQRLAKEAERARLKAEKEALRKSREKAKGLGDIARLPVARHERELHRLATRLGDDVAALRGEFADFIGVGGGELSAEKTEPWPDPVDTAELLRDCSNKIHKHVVVQDLQSTAAVLWVAHAWLYDHEVPTHSPILAATSAEADSGKTTLVVVVGRMSPRFSLNIEMTGPTLFRTVDATKPTLVLDEADDLFNRKCDLKHIVNAGWSRVAKIPRQVNIRGVWFTAYFDCFTPKAISLLGRNLPRPTRTRCVELRMQPKRRNEQVEDFNQLDDVEFAVLRRKFARWAADNAAALKDAKPVIPAGSARYSRAARKSCRRQSRPSCARTRPPSGRNTATAGRSPSGKSRSCSTHTTSNQRTSARCA